MNKFLAGTIVLCFLQVNAQSDFSTATHYIEANSEPREHTIDIERTRVEFSFDAANGLVKGRVTHAFSPLRATLDKLEFDGIDLRISEVLVNGKKAEFENDGKTITVKLSPALTWNTKDSVVFTYEANPRKGVYFVGWNDPKNIMRKQIWTQGEDTDHRYWIPMYDDPNDKVILTSVITFDKSYRVIANGKKISEKENKDGTKTWTYAMSNPHAPYLLMLAIGLYDVKNLVTKSGVQIQLWSYPDQPNRLEPTFGFTKRVMEFLEEEIGVPYPWAVFANIPVANFVTGAMENTTAVLTGDFWYVDERGYLEDNYVDTDFHEVAHQWFGDLTTMRSWKHLWLNESFATYYAKMGMKKYFGEEYYQWNRRTEQESALKASLKDRLPLVHTQAGSARYYPKGSAIIDMMNYVYGRDAYRRVIAHFFSHNKFQNVETHDLVKSFMDTLGVTPDWFFDQWIYRGGEPDYEVRYADLGTWTEFTVNQIHTQDRLTGLFKMPIVFEVHYTDGTKDSLRTMIEKASEWIKIPNPSRKKIAYTLFDPGSWIIKNVTFKKSFEEFSEQSKSAVNMIDRYDAIAAMKSFPASQKRDLLIAIFSKEKFHAIKAEIVTQLAFDRDEKTINFLRSALNDPWTEVRKTAVNSIKVISTTLLEDFEKRLSDSAYGISQSAFLKLSDMFPDNGKRYAEIAYAQDGLDHEIRISALEWRASHDDPSARKSLMEFASPSYNNQTRRAAFFALRRLNHLDDEFIGYLFGAMLDANEGFSDFTFSIAEYFNTQTVHKQNFRAYYNSHEWKDWQKRILKRLIK